VALQWADVGRENAWLIPVLGVVGVAVTFATAGPVWGLLGIYLVLVLAIIALGNSVRMRRSGLPSSTSEARPSIPTVPAEQRRESLGQPAAQVPMPSSGETQEAGPGDATGPLPAPDGKSAAKSTNHPILDALVAANSSDPAGVRSALEPWIKEASDRAEEKAREAQMRYWLVRAGAEHELDNLRSLADSNPGLSEPALYLAMALQDYGEPLEAAQELQRRIADLPESEHPRILLAESRMRRAAGHAMEAESCARKALAFGALSSSLRAEALKELGYSLEHRGRRPEAFASFERSLEIEPTERSLRFHLAYQYAADGLREPAIAHYEALVDRGDDAAKNNLGIQFLEFGLPATGVELLKQSSAAGTSLAAGNLAMNLVTAGYADEARSWIERGRATGEAHARVEEAALRLAANPQEEAAVVKEIRSRGRDLRQVFRLLFDDQASVPEGAWQVSTGSSIDFASNGNSSTGSVGVGAGKVTVDFALEGTRLTIKYSVGEFGLNSRNGLAAWDGERILAYLKDWPASPSSSPLTFTKLPTK
jgi:tetratricopeptide (TPR) repeat protein